MFQQEFFSVLIFNEGSVEEQVGYYGCFGTYCTVSQHPKKMIVGAVDAAEQQELSEDTLLPLQC